jgi:hypothetical protein
MEVLLLAIATYRKSDPTVEVQCEFLENAFDILSASLLCEDNVTDFVVAEGIELMLRCVRQKVHAGVGHYGCLTLHCRDHPPPLPWLIAMTTRLPRRMREIRTRWWNQATVSTVHVTKVGNTVSGIM